MPNSRAASKLKKTALQVTVFVPKLTPRIMYVLDYLSGITGDSFRGVDCASLFNSWQGKKIWYADGVRADAISIPNSGFLMNDELKVYSPEVRMQGGLPRLFPLKGHGVGYDMFSAIFYMLSRYEEYLPFAPDNFQRFPAAQSLAYQNGFLETPVVDLWVSHLSSLLHGDRPIETAQSHTFAPLFTYDIDFAYQYLGKTSIRTIGGLARDLLNGRFEEAASRFLVVSYIKKDPWNVYETILKSVAPQGLSTLFFFPTGNASKYDKHLSHNNRTVAALIRKIAKRTGIGLHASFTSYRSASKIATQKQRLEAVCRQKITASRQHYLRLSFPQTYESLLKHGITQDYSMAFPDAPGYRAGTCKPFFYYDLRHEATTKLKVFPAAVMDATFEYYLPFSQAAETFERHLLVARKLGGAFIPIWHNNHLARSKWMAIHNRLINQISKCPIA